MSIGITEKFIELFGAESIFKFEESDLIKLKSIAPKVRNSLLIEGLPNGAAPEFQFDRDMEIINEPYISIGDGIDFRPILLNIEAGSVYEDFGSNKLKIINSDLSLFKQFLILYAEMVEKAIEKNGSQAYLENNIPSTLIDLFYEKINVLDSDVCGMDSFWGLEIKRLRFNVK